MTIRRLSPQLVDQIAAGEVVARPASALKELVENAIDAGANILSIHLLQGGRTLIRVQDNGRGIVKDQLSLAVEKHATSKLPDEKLFDIRSFGFRGEALAAIRSVSRMTLVSRTKDSDVAWQLGPEDHEPQPMSSPLGTTVIVEDLFFKIPARLKFLKSAQAELGGMRQLIFGFALSHPFIQFEITHENKPWLKFGSPQGSEPSWEDVMRERLRTIISSTFASEAVLVKEAGDKYQLRAFLGLPTHNAPTQKDQHIFVNGRPVKDKVILMALRLAYDDLIPRGRFPAAVLFLDVPAIELDVNVHPAKTEVRFASPQAIKEFLIETLKQALKTHAQKTSQAVSIPFAPSPDKEEGFALPHDSARREQSPQQISRSVPSPQPRHPSGTYAQPASSPALSLAEERTSYVCTPASQASDFTEAKTQDDKEGSQLFNPDHPLGSAIGQIHKSYIVAENADGLLIVDQHAAHERIVYETLKMQIGTEVQQEALLIPEFISLEPTPFIALESHQSDLKKLGLHLEFTPPQTVVLYSVPSLLKHMKWHKTLSDMGQFFAAHGDEGLSPIDLIDQMIRHILGNHACKNSIKANQPLSQESANHLLRTLEKTPHAGQCNHGRPTMVTLTLKDLERLFKRTG
jgi:DNA mismatch repair protein MutL